MALPIDFEAVENAIQSWMATATGLKTIWRSQSAPQLAYPFASLLLLSGPSMVGGRDELRNSTDNTVSRVRIIPTAQDSTTYEVTVNTTPFQYVSDADATVEEITAGLTAAINLGAEPVTATDNGTDMDVEADVVGDTWTLELTDTFDGEQMVYANLDAGHEVLQEAVGLRELTVSCQVYVGSADVADPIKHSRALMSAAQAALGLPSVLSAFSAAGLAVIDEGSIANIDELFEDARVSRANLDVRFYLASNLEERTGYLEAALISSDLGIPASLELDDERFGEQP